MKDTDIIRNSQDLDEKVIFMRHLQGRSFHRLAKDVRDSIGCSFPAAYAYVQAAVSHAELT